MKKFFIAIYIVLIFIAVKLAFTFYMNEKFIDNYNQQIYSYDDIQYLFILNIFEPYIVYYNYGNILYQNGDFEEAIVQYRKALTLFPPHRKECDIRINLALAMLKQINEDDKSEENRQKILDILEEAKQVLCEKGCANEYDDNGHSEEAERLKKDIENKEKELQNSEESESENEEENENEKENEEQEKNTLDEKEEQLRNIQVESGTERQDELESTNIWGYDYYSGKRW